MVYSIIPQVLQKYKWMFDNYQSCCLVHQVVANLNLRSLPYACVLREQCFDKNIVNFANCCTFPLPSGTLWQVFVCRFAFAPA